MEILERLSLLSSEVSEATLTWISFVRMGMPEDKTREAFEELDAKSKELNRRLKDYFMPPN